MNETVFVRMGKAIEIKVVPEMANVKYLYDRAELLRMTRRFFDDRGFMEVQPPCLSRDCVVDAYLDPLSVDVKELGITDPRLPDRFYLQTSPESAMKRLLSNGAPSIYSLGPVFRGGEMGELHNVEFTMLEWYQVGGDANSAIALSGDFVSDVLNADGYDLITYREAFIKFLDIDPLEVPIRELATLVPFGRAAMADTIDSDRDSLLDILLSQSIAPNLGFDRPLVLTEYPLSQAALAKRSSIDQECAARFELFVKGVEIANGYDELLDPNEMKNRFDEQNRKRQDSGRRPLATDSTLLHAMRRGLPECSGVALGIDRLLMLRVGAKQIQDVIPFSIWEA